MGVTDQVKVRMDSKWICAWAATDADTKAIVVVHSLTVRAGLDTFRFSRMGKPDGGQPFELLDRGL